MMPESLPEFFGTTAPMKARADRFRPGDHHWPSDGPLIMPSRLHVPARDPLGYTDQRTINST